MQFRNFLVLLLGILVCISAAVPAQAADVVLGGKVVFRIDDADQELAKSISNKIEAMLQNGAQASSIKVVRKDEITKTKVEKEDPKDPKKKVTTVKETKKSFFFIYWGNEMIVEVTPEIAKLNASDPQSLALVWSENMRKIAAIGLLNVSLNKVVLPIDAEKVLTTTGLAQGTLQAVDPAGCVAVTVDQETGNIALKGITVGKSKIIVSKGKAVREVYVAVKDWAGKLPKDLVVEVTGDPALAGAVSQAALLAIATNTTVYPGCGVYIDDTNLVSCDVTKGDSMRIAIPVGITATDDYFPVKGEVFVKVQNVPIPPVEQNLLLVSNRPERVDVDGILLNYTFRKKEPTRLMYSHMNESEDRRNLWVNLSNPQDEPLKIVVNWSSAGPERSEVHVGQTSAMRFLQTVGVQSGYIVTLPPKSALEIAYHDMKPQALVTGFATFRILEGESATVEVRTCLAPSANDGKPMPNIGAPFNPFKIHPHGVFAQPYFENDAEYTVGTKPLVFKYGESPWLIDFETGLPNTGNFGVLYKSLVEFKNPTKYTKQVGLYFTPLSGPGGANFLIGQKVFQAPFRKVGEEVLVTKIELAPNSTSSMEFITFPEASSCYPAQYELRDI